MIPAAWTTPVTGGRDKLSRAFLRSSLAPGLPRSKEIVLTATPKASMVLTLLMMSALGPLAVSDQVDLSGRPLRERRTRRRAPFSANQLATSRPKAPRPPVMRYVPSGRILMADFRSLPGASEALGRARRRAILLTPSRTVTTSASWMNLRTWKGKAGSSMSIKPPHRSGCSEAMIRARPNIEAAAREYSLFAFWTSSVITQSLAEELKVLRRLVVSRSLRVLAKLVWGSLSISSSSSGRTITTVPVLWRTSECDSSSLGLSMTLTPRPRLVRVFLKGPRRE